MRILIYGAGAVGLYYADKFTEADHNVTLIDPRVEEGERNYLFRDSLAEGREQEGERRRLMRLLNETPIDESFTLMLVTLSSHRVAEHLEGIRRAAKGLRWVMFIGSFVRGMDRWAEDVGRSRCLFAYPGVSAVLEREENRVVYLDREETGGDVRGITAGALHGEAPDGAGELCGVFTEAGIPVNRSEDMEGVFLSQASIRLPMTAALYSAGGSLAALDERGDLLRLMIKAIREALAVIRLAGHELTPSSLSMYRYVPVFIIANMMRARFGTVSSSLGIEETALGAGDEPARQSKEFLELSEKIGAKNEHLHFLFSIYEVDEESEETGDTELIR